LELGQKTPERRNPGGHERRNPGTYPERSLTSWQEARQPQQEFNRRIFQARMEMAFEAGYQ
jgi:hypothetical protein